MIPPSLRLRSRLFSSAQVATKWVGDEIMIHARDNNCSIVTISLPADYQKYHTVAATAIAVQKSHTSPSHNEKERDSSLEKACYHASF